MGWFGVLFFVSGFCGLVYETVWLRLAMGAFGVTAPFVALFLAVFMGGLGLGSWAGGALARRARRPLALYALCELGLAACARLVPAALAFFARRLAGPAWGSAGFYAASGLLTAATLLPACLLMGATYPFAMADIERRFAGSQER